jgi:cell division protein FtsZ
MANAKRASMREGPLAALFRKTEETGRERRRRARAAARREQPARAAARPLPPAARSRAARHPQRPGAPEPPARERPAAPRAERRERRAEEPRERRGAHAAGAPAPRLLLGDPRERDGAPAPRPAAPDDYTRVSTARPQGEPPADRRAVGQPVIRVVGVGGAGVNAVNRMVEAEVEGVEFLAINTDLQSLQQSAADDHAAHRRRAHPRPRLGLGRRTRPPGGDGGVRPRSRRC